MSTITILFSIKRTGFQIFKISLLNVLYNPKNWGLNIYKTSTYNRELRVTIRIHVYVHYFFPIGIRGVRPSRQSIKLKGLQNLKICCSTFWHFITFDDWSQPSNLNILIRKATICCNLSTLALGSFPRKVHAYCIFCMYELTASYSQNVFPENGTSTSISVDGHNSN